MLLLVPDAHPEPRLSDGQLLQMVVVPRPVRPLLLQALLLPLGPRPVGPLRPPMLLFLLLAGAAMVVGLRQEARHLLGAVSASHVVVDGDGVRQGGVLLPLLQEEEVVHVVAGGAARARVVAAAVRHQVLCRLHAAGRAAVEAALLAAAVPRPQRVELLAAVEAQQARPGVARQVEEVAAVHALAEQAPRRPPLRQLLHSFKLAILVHAQTSLGTEVCEH